MKATMDADGLVTIQAETAVEAYALQRWAKEAWVDGCSVGVPGLGFWSASKMIVIAQVAQQSGSVDKVEGK